MITSTDILFVIAFTISVLYYFIQSQFSYWKRNRIPYIPPTPILGNLKDIVFMKASCAEFIQNLYHHKLAENEPVVGIYLFHNPALFIREPELIKRILVKDFNKFSNRYSTADPHNDTLGANNLFFMRNPEWKIMRSKLSPSFTSGRMKQMFILVNDIGKQLDAHLCDLTANKNVCVEVKETCALYTTDVIASTAFGIQANSIKNPDGEFRKKGREIFNFTIKRALEFTTIFFIPQLVSIFKCKIFSKESTQFLRSTISYIMNEREKSGISRNDLIDTLIALKNESLENANNKDSEKITFDGDVLVSQAGAFFTAGYETTSTTMAFALYEISKYPDIEARLRDEIKNTLKVNNGEITYEAIQNMEYLNMVVQEVLRLYPPLPFLDRKCSLANDEKGYSLEPYCDFIIPNDMPVYIPIFAIQRDPKYFPDPETFNPERFAPENKTNLLSATYMPFGNGPHNCIGERFGLMTAKIGLIHFFKNHYVRPSAKSSEKMQLDRMAFILQAKGGIHCEIIRDPLLI